MAAGKQVEVSGGYKLGGISDLLSNTTCDAESKDHAKELDNLFSGESSAVTFTEPAIVIATKRKDKIRPPLSSSTKIEESVGTSTEKASSKRKRVGLEVVSSNEPTRKIQRMNRKKYKTSDNAESRESTVDEAERLSRTIFVGNVSIDATKKELKSIFSKYGKVESVRFRSVPVAGPKHSKKVAILKKEFHPERNTMNAYIVYEEKSETEKALAAKGTEFKGMHLRVDLAAKRAIDNKQSVFIGNLPFNVNEEDIRKHFSQCGDVDDVRVIRDKKTGAGKGFGYVTFKERESVTFAVKLQNSDLAGRKIRVFRSVEKDKADRPFNKKKDRQFRMKDVSLKGDSGQATKNNKKFSIEKKKGGSKFQSSQRSKNRNSTKSNFKSKLSVKKNTHKFQGSKKK
eukprot:gene8697-14717_t